MSIRNSFRELIFTFQTAYIFLGIVCFSVWWGKDLPWVLCELYREKYLALTWNSLSQLLQINFKISKHMKSTTSETKVYFYYLMSISFVEEKSKQNFLLILYNSNYSKTWCWQDPLLSVWSGGVNITMKEILEEKWVSTFTENFVRYSLCLPTALGCRSAAFCSS